MSNHDDLSTEGTREMRTPDARTHPTEGGPADGRPDDNEAETFPRAVVEKLRRENAEQRVKAKAADDLARRLHVALVAADGRLVAPDELPFDAAHLEDAQTLTAAIDELLERKPYLGARRVRGDVGQGRSTHSTDVDLAGILRSRA